MGLLQFKPNNQGRRFKEDGHRGKNTQQMGGSDLQTWTPFPHHVSISLDTQMSPILHRGPTSTAHVTATPVSPGHLL